MVTVSPKTIIWDMDGTLINSLETYRGLVVEAMKNRKIPVPNIELFMQNHHGSLEETLQAITGIEDEATIEGIIADFLVLQNEKYKHIDDLFYADAVDLAQRAYKAGIKQIIVTNRDHQGRGSASPHIIVANSQLSKAIGHVVAGDDHAFRKPDIRVLDVVKDHDFSSDVLVIGDQFVDAKLALNLEARAILVNRVGEIPHLDLLGDGWESQVHIVDSLDEVQVQ